MGTRIKTDFLYDSYILEYKDIETAEKMCNAINECCENIDRYNDIYVIQIFNNVQLIGSSTKLNEIIETLKKGVQL